MENFNNNSNHQSEYQHDAQLSGEPNIDRIGDMLSHVKPESQKGDASSTLPQKDTLQAQQTNAQEQVDAGLVSKGGEAQATPNIDDIDAQQTLTEASEVVATIKQTQIDKYDELESYKRLRKKRTKRLIARLVVFAVLMVLLPVIIFLCSIVIDKNSQHNFFGKSYYLVVSNSMEPEIKVNDLVVLKKVKNTAELNVGDDIGYINDDGQVVVHRIIAKDTNNYMGQVQYYTKGVNNVGADRVAVQQDQIVGVRVATHHGLGQMLTFFRSTGGIVVLVLILGTIIAGFIVAFKFTEDIRYVPDVK